LAINSQTAAQFVEIHRRTTISSAAGQSTSIAQLARMRLPKTPPRCLHPDPGRQRTDAERLFSNNGRNDDRLEQIEKDLKPADRVQPDQGGGVGDDNQPRLLANRRIVSSSAAISSSVMSTSKMPRSEEYFMKSASDVEELGSPAHRDFALAIELEDDHLIHRLVDGSVERGKEFSDFGGDIDRHAGFLSRVSASFLDGDADD